jgi:hypothetical protein
VWRRRPDRPVPDGVLASDAAAASTATLVGRYAQRFDARYAVEHGVASPLGLWLLLALLAPATAGQAREGLEAELGTDVADAHARAVELLAVPHPAVHAAVAAWARRFFLGPAFTTWATTLPPTVETGDVPTPARADAWAAEHTGGLIVRFPVQITDLTAVVLASALATDVTWIEPFAPVPATALGGPFGAVIKTALRADLAHVQALVDTEAAGIVAVHAADATTGLRVLSVIAAPEVEPARVHEAAHAVTARLGASRRTGDPDAPARVLDLFDVPLGEGHTWTLTEEERQAIVYDGADRTQATTTFLAAWSASSDHDLLDAPGVREALDALEGFLLPDALPAAFDVRQAAAAECTRFGFRAAAVTAMGMRGGSAASPIRKVRHREAVIRFARPYAVLSVSRCTRSATSSGVGAPVASARPHGTGSPSSAPGSLTPTTPRPTTPTERSPPPRRRVSGDRAAGSGRDRRRASPRTDRRRPARGAASRAAGTRPRPRPRRS